MRLCSIQGCSQVEVYSALVLRFALRWWLWWNLRSLQDGAVLVLWITGVAQNGMQCWASFQADAAWCFLIKQIGCSVRLTQKARCGSRKKRAVLTPRKELLAQKNRRGGRMATTLWLPRKQWMLRSTYAQCGVISNNSVWCVGKLSVFINGTLNVCLPQALRLIGKIKSANRICLGKYFYNI